VRAKSCTPTKKYTALIYKKSLQTSKGDVYSFYFSERGVPKEIHSKKKYFRSSPGAAHYGIKFGWC
jgi:hypothetical protein